MAQRRMFNKTVTNNDNFLEMPDSSQNLYFHLSMNADDDGFVDNWKSIIRMTGHKEDDLKVLIAKQYVIPFESGVIVIKHWRLNNYLRNDRFTSTQYIDEKNQLVIDDKHVYQLDTNGIPNGNPDKTRLDKTSIDNISFITTTTNIYKNIEENFGRTISPMEYQKIEEWLLLFDEEVINYAVTIAVMNNKKTFNYINGILNNWKSEGYKTLEDIKFNKFKSDEMTEKEKEILNVLDEYDWIEEGKDNEWNH